VFAPAGADVLAGRGRNEFPLGCFLPLGFKPLVLPLVLVHPPFPNPFPLGWYVRNPILVTIPIQPMNSSISRTYYTCNNKTLNTVDGDEKEKGKTHVS
jgi:hypothetical protein